MDKFSRAHPFFFAYVALAVYLVLAPRVFLLYSPSGDEPEYLRIAHSIIHDFDLDISNNTDYAENVVSRKQFPWLEEHDTRLIERGGAKLPLHNIGYPLLIAPAYAAGGRYGAIVFGVFIALLAVCNLGLLAREVTGAEFAAQAAVLVAAVTVPVFFYTFSIYPSMAALLLELYAFRKLLRHSDSRPAPLWAAGLALAALPWMHYRYVFLILLVIPGAYFALGMRGRARFAALILPTAVSFAILAWFQFRVFGGFVLLDIESGNIALSVRGFIGLLFDQEFGLLLYAPYYLLAPAGIALMAKKRPREIAFLALIFLFHYVQFSIHTHWWGDWSPTGRRHIEYIPLLIVPLVYALNARGAAFKTVFALFTLPALAAALITALYPSVLIINEGNGVNRLFSFFFSTRAPSLAFPSMMIATPREYALSALWLTAFAAVNILLIRSLKKRFS